MNTAPTERILAALEEHGCDPRPSGNGNKAHKARRPAHDDRNPSSSVDEGDNGRALIHCHAGCDPQAVLEADGLKPSDLFPQRADSAQSHGGESRPVGQVFASPADALAALEHRQGTHSVYWDYHAADGQHVGRVIRWDGPAGKTIRPLAKYSDGWRIGAMPKPRVLYKLPEILKADPNRPVLILEDERCADAARQCDLVATTSAGGAKAAAQTDWTPLRGRRVVILPDNDAAGERYASDVAGLCHKAGAAEVKILRLADYAPALPEGGDLADAAVDPGWCGLPLGDAASLADLGRWILATAERLKPWTPEPAEGGAPAWKPFPVDALPEPLRELVAAGSKAIGCDPSYVALPLLTEMAAAIGNTRRLRLKQSWTVPAILWAAIVGESGTAKTPAFRLAMRPIQERQRKALKRHAEAMRKYEADRARYDKEMTEWKRGKRKDAGGDPPEEPEPPQAERCVVSDTTVEALVPILLANPRGLLLARDELAGWIGSFDRYANGKGDAAHWLSMNSGENITVDRKTANPRTIFVPQAAVSICGGIQPAILQRALGTEHRESGLAARFLLAYPPRRPRQWTEADIDPAIEERVAQVVDRLFELQPAVGNEGEPRPVLVGLTPAAKGVWIDYYNAHAQEQADLAGDLASAWSKLEEAAARLALVVHYVRWASGELADERTLDAASMEAGIRLAQWFKHEARRVYAMLDESDADREVRRLVEWIERQGGTATPSEVQKGCWWLREHGAAERAIDSLVKAGRGYWEPPDPSRRGRPARRFRLLALNENPPNGGGGLNENSKNAGKTGFSLRVDNVESLKPDCTETGPSADADNWADWL